MNTPIACVRYCTAVPTVLRSSQVQLGPKVPHSLIVSSRQSTALNSQTNLQIPRMCLLHLMLACCWLSSLAVVTLQLLPLCSTLKLYGINHSFNITLNKCVI